MNAVGKLVKLLKETRGSVYKLVHRGRSDNRSKQ